MRNTSVDRIPAPQGRAFAPPGIRRRVATDTTAPEVESIRAKRLRTARGEVVAASRRFARYRPTEGESRGRRVWTVPKAGLCVSVFVLVGDPKNPNLVVLGRPSPAAPWSELGNLEPPLLEALHERWLLPACHLVEFETPRAAAERVVREQLGLDHLELRGPEVFTEAYPFADSLDLGNHWDLDFLFRADWPHGHELRSPAFKELRLIDTRTIGATNLGRGHGDILMLAGYPLGARIT